MRSTHRGGHMAGVQDALVAGAPLPNVAPPHIWLVLHSWLLHLSDHLW